MPAGMVVMVPTGRATELVELAPTHCPNGHPLGPRQVLVGYGTRPDGVRARSWTCRTCTAITWDDDATTRLA